MSRIFYVGTAEDDGTIHILRQIRSEANDRETVAELQPGFSRYDANCASRLAKALLEDCLRDEIRVMRVQQRIADLLTSRLLLHPSWILTGDDLEAAVEAVEELEGWIWLEEGFYLDQDPRAGPDYVH